MLNKPHQLLFAYGGRLIWSKTLVESFILILNILSRVKKNNNSYTFLFMQ
jgi:hypothetical protein